jgi:CubicO group peptidase (beta-lactamase class C family)
MKHLRILPLLVVYITATGQRHITINDHKINIDSLNKDVGVMLDATNVPGMSLAIFNDKKVLYFHTYGYREKKSTEKVDKRTVFEAASLTKSFLVFVAHQLVQEGKLDLDKPMYQYLPEPRLEHDQRYKRITPRMILSHSSGIENWQRFNNPDTLEILADPGTQFVYSGEGYMYLAKVVEKILHQPYDVYIKERVLKPLHLKNSFMHYIRKGKYPKDYAIGYNSFGKEYQKWKNDVAVPASGGHVNARDYARLVINLFNGKYLSDSEARSICQPVINIDNTPSYYYGLGYEVLYSAGDTIIFHGGSNDGFRSFICYSTVRKCGLVYFTNSDRGNLLAMHMNDITLGLPIATKFASDPIAQYPSKACILFKVYNDSGSEAMMTRMKQLEAQNDGKLDDLTLNEIGYMFFSAHLAETSEKVFWEYLRLYPQSPVPYYFLGRLQMDKKQYELAYSNLLKAKELNFSFFPIDWDIETCAREMTGNISITHKP